MRQMCLYESSISPDGGSRSSCRSTKVRSSEGSFLEIEQIVECLPGTRCGRGSRLPLDRPARRERRALVRFVLRTYARSDFLPALEYSARVERLALDAGVQR